MLITRNNLLCSNIHKKQSAVSPKGYIKQKNGIVIAICIILPNFALSF